VTAGRAASSGGHRLEHRVLIAAPRDRVWRLVEEPEALMQWVHGLRSVTAADGGPGGFALGATFVQRVKIGLVPSACKGEVTAFEAPSRLAVVVHHALFALDIGYDFAADGRRATAVVCQASVRGMALGTVIPRRKGEAVTLELLEEHLSALRALAERTGTR
jgi:uncharacterized protein YndB with AHSA1/START domain